MSDSKSNTVISTRVRLARNIDGYPFPAHLKDEKANEIIRKVSGAVKNLDEFDMYNMDSISKEDAFALMENRLISPKLIENSQISAAMINREEAISIMINEEDHLREQCIVKGKDIKLAYAAMSSLDKTIASSLKFAYDDQFGYLTACPTNLGTGLRVSVMMFLPALTLRGAMDSIMRSVSRMGLTVRGSHGEGSDAEGFEYQISNEVTLGLTEDEILAQVDDVADRICARELEARKQLIENDTTFDLKDRCLRSLGILENCARLTSEELLNLSSYVKLGACLGYIPLKDVSAIDDLVVKMRPSNIMSSSDKQLSTDERDIYRADYVGKYLKKTIGKA